MCGEMPGMFIISRAIYLSGYLSISRDIYLSIFVPGCPSPGLSISRDIYPSPGLSISRAVHLPGCLSPRLSVISRAICLPGYLFPGLSISRTISLDIYLSVYLSLHLPGHLPVSLPICPRPCWLRSRQRQAQNPRNAPAPFPCPAPGRAAEILGAAGTAPCRSARGGAAFAPEGARCVRAGILGSPPSPPGFFSCCPSAGFREASGAGVILCASGFYSRSWEGCADFGRDAFGIRDLREAKPRRIGKGLPCPALCCRGSRASLPGSSLPPRAVPVPHPSCDKIGQELAAGSGSASRGKDALEGSGDGAGGLRGVAAGAGDAEARCSFGVFRIPFVPGCWAGCARHRPGIPGMVFFGFFSFCPKTERARAAPALPSLPFLWSRGKVEIRFCTSAVSGAARLWEKPPRGILAQKAEFWSCVPWHGSGSVCGEHWAGKGREAGQDKPLAPWAGCQHLWVSRVGQDPPGRADWDKEGSGDAEEAEIPRCSGWVPSLVLGAEGLNRNIRAKPWQEEAKTGREQSSQSGGKLVKPVGMWEPSRGAGSWTGSADPRHLLGMETLASGYFWNNCLASLQKRPGF